MQPRIADGAIADGSIIVLALTVATLLAASATAAQEPVQEPLAGAERPTPSAQAPAAQPPAPNPPASNPPASSAAKAEEILALVKETTGADAADLRSFAFEAETRRMFGEREMPGAFTMRFLFPDTFQRVDEMERPDGMRAGAMTRTIDGDEAWVDRDGGAGPGFGGRRDGPGAFGPVAPPAGPGVERGGDVASAMRGEFYRALLGILPGAPALASLTFAHVGEAHADSGQVAEVIDVTGERFAARLFVDQETHLPLMMTYEAPNLLGTMGGRRATPPAGAPGQGRRRAGGQARGEGQGDRPAGQRGAEVQRRAEAQGPAPMIEHQLFFSEYDTEEGLRIPRRIVRHVDGEVQEEWTITKVELNPVFDPEQFQRRGTP